MCHAFLEKKVGKYKWRESVLDSFNKRECIPDSYN